MERNINERISEYKEVFAVFDGDRDGYINRTEFGNSIRALGRCISEKDIDRMIESMSINMKQDSESKDMKIDFQTFIVLLSKNVKSKDESRKELLGAFEMFDPDKKGVVNSTELTSFLHNLGETIKQNELEEFLRDASPDKDGNINYLNFIDKLLSNWVS